MQRASEGSPFLFLWMREKDAEIAEIVAGGSGEEGVAEVGEEGKGVAASEEVLRREMEGVRAGERCAVGNGARGGGVAVDAVGSGAENGDGLAGDFFNASENEGGIAAADSLPRDRTADFAVGDERDAPAGIRAAEVFELGQEIFDGASERPIVGCVVAASDEAVGFSGVMGDVKKIVRG